MDNAILRRVQPGFGDKGHHRKQHHNIEHDPSYSLLFKQRTKIGISKSTGLRMKQGFEQSLARGEWAAKDLGNLILHCIWPARNGIARHLCRTLF